MKKWLALGAIFFTMYLVFLIATLPASVALNAITLPKAVSIQGVSGTLWKTHIQQVDFVQRNKQTLTLQQVKASLSFWSVLTFNPAIDLEFGQPMLAGIQGKVTVSNLTADVTFTDGEIFIAANALAHQLPLPLPVTAKGDIRLNLIQFTLGKPICQVAMGDIQWSKAGVIALDESIKLGELKADFGCDKGALKLVVDPKNDLGLSFTARIKNNGKVSGNGFIKPGKAFPKSLSSVLPFLGNADSKGRYILRL